MDRKELVLKTFHNEPTNKLLVGFWHHFLDDELVDGFHNPEYIKQNLEGAKKFKEEFDPDFVKVMTDGLFFMPFNYEEMNCAADFRNFKATDEMDKYLDTCVEFAKATREIYGNDVLMYYNIFSPTFQINHRMNQTHPDKYKDATVAPIAQLIQEDPAAMQVGLDVIADYTEKLIDKVVGAGIMDGIYFSVSCFNREIVPEIYKKYVEPGEERIIAKANSLRKDNLLHICGWRGNLNNLSIYTDYDCSVINWAVHAENVPVAEGKKLFHNKCVIAGFGNNNTDLICVGSKKEIQDYVEQIVEEAGTTGVIIGADCTLHLDTPDEHVHWVYEKAAEISERLMKNN